MPGVDRLRSDEVREALRLLGGGEPPASKAQAQRRLGEHLRAAGTVRTALEAAAAPAREAFDRLIADGPASVDDLLGRGWWGHGTLPPPLDWLQRRGLIAVDDDDRVAVLAEALDGYLQLEPGAGSGRHPGSRGVLAEADGGGEAVAGSVRVEAVTAVVVASSPAALNRAVAVPAARLRAVAPTVALSQRSPAAVSTALRTAGVRLADDVAVAAVASAPALPGTPEDAVGPRAIRALLDRALDEQRQVRLRYFASSRGGAATDRVVDPWSFGEDLLRGYCHLREDERTFAVDRIGHARLLPSAVEHTAG